ncbi:MAG TPA: hypothetical protein VG985_03640, partial [Xanthobacteraceae bacterium]|nr:hypothetical protein [Xanthobacteraceae bacterium]
LCTFIRSSEKSVKLQQLQLPRSGPDGQPIESSQLERFRAKHVSVRVKKTRQGKNLESRF